MARTFEFSVLAACVLLALIAPAAIYPGFLSTVLCFALVASAFSLLTIVGLVSFGHAMFFGGSAYLAGYAMKTFDLPLEIGLPLGLLCGAAMGALTGAVAVRRNGIYFVMVTLGLNQIAYFIFLQAPFTGGEDGLQGITRRSLLPGIDLSNEATLYYFLLVVFCLAMGFIHLVMRSPFGQMLKAIRDNEPRVVSLGYDVLWIKWLCFVVSAALAGLAGACKAATIQTAALTDVTWFMSGDIMLMAFIGGVSTFVGPIFGALIVVAMQTYLASLGEWVVAAQGAAFVFIVLLFRDGIAGILPALKAASPRPASPNQAAGGEAGRPGFAPKPSPDLKNG